MDPPKRRSRDRGGCQGPSPRLRGRSPPSGRHAHGRLVTLQIIKKKGLKGDVQGVYDEIEVLTGLDHPNVGE